MVCKLSFTREQISTQNRPLFSAITFAASLALQASVINSVQAQKLEPRAYSNAPIGGYDSKELLNLGSNRWSLRSELGVSEIWDQWTLEGVTGVRIFSNNDDFLGSQTLEQKPIGSLKGSAIYSLPRPGWWTSFSLAYGEGGRTRIDGISKFSPCQLLIGTGSAYGSTPVLIMAQVAILTQSAWSIHTRALQGLKKRSRYPDCCGLAYNEISTVA